VKSRDSRLTQVYMKMAVKTVCVSVYACVFVYMCMCREVFCRLIVVDLLADIVSDFIES